MENTTAAPVAKKAPAGGKKAAGKTVAKKTAGKRHQGQARTTGNIAGIKAPALRRIARRGGVKRIGNEVFVEARNVMEGYLNTIIRDTVVYTRHNGRKTVTCEDVSHSLSHNGFPVYGFGN